MALSAPRSFGGRGGFTLLEILVTLGLIALLSGVLVLGVNSLLTDRPKTVDELFWTAVQEVRRNALLNNRDTRLRFDPDSREFVAGSAGGEMRYGFVPREEAEFDFLAPRSSGGSSAILLGGDLVETRTVPFVTFFSDGTCSPFRVQFRTRNGPRVIEIDPWTCAPVLAANPTP